MDPGLCIATLALIALGLHYFFTPPAHLRHLPRVPVLQLLWSYASGEVDDARIKRLIIPYANQHNEDIVLVYSLGRWIVHAVDSQIAQNLFADIHLWQKEEPQDDMLLWRFIGRTNVILSNGSSWKRHSKVVREAFDRNTPIDEFVHLAKKLFGVMGKGGQLLWNDLTMRYALDAVGTTALGHDFDAISNDHGSPFLNKYHGVMEAIANPLYLFFPKLERYFPRKQIVNDIDSLVVMFQDLLNQKKEDKGNDMLTYMLDDPEMSDTELRDNMVVFFIAGHDTTAGSMASFVYYLAKHPEFQVRARKEAEAALKKDQGEPTVENLREMPFIQACIREALRLNTPITCVVPRSANVETTLKGKNKTYALPANTAVILNITSIHCNDRYWPDAERFDPSRFLGKDGGQTSKIDSSIWVPFGLGPRQCPARNFALYELRTLAAMLLNEWEWTLPVGSPHEDGIKNGFSPFALSLPKDLGIHFKRRHHATA